MSETAIKYAIIENVVTVFCISAIVLGLFYMNAGGWSFLGLLLALNLNAIELKKNVDRSTDAGA